jgi:DNA-binding CsgD family transcriptional regulator
VRTRAKKIPEPAYRLGPPACQLLKLLGADTCRHYEQAAHRLIATALPIDRCYFMFAPAGGTTTAYFPDLEFSGTSRRRFRDGSRNDLWFRNHPAQPDMNRVVRHSDHTPVADLKQSAFYRRVLKPLGVLFGLSLVFWNQTNYLGCLTLLRAGQHGDFKPGEIETMDSLRDQVLNDSVRKLSDRYHLRTEANALRSTLYLSSEAVAVAASSGKIVGASRQALRVLGSWNGNGAVTHKLPRVYTKLPERLRLWCISGPASISSQHPRWSVRVTRLSALDRQHNALFLLKFWPSEGTSTGASKDLLTETEVDLVHHLKKGLTNQEIGRIRGTSPYTVKAQISHLLRKLGCRNRIALAVLFSRAANPRL